MDANEHRRRATAEAAEWWELLEAEELSLEKRAQFVDWLRESALHVSEMLHIAQVHGALEQFQRWQHIAVVDPEATGAAPVPVHDPAAVRPLLMPRTVPAVRGGWPLRRIGVGICLAMVVAAVIAVRLGLFSGSVVETARGERRALSLADGSVVTIDPETRLRIRFDGRFRRIFLERGRARFRVAKDRSRPFLVRADGTVVRAVGTDFGVEHRASGIVVTVAEGTVAVVPRPRDGPGSPAAITGASSGSNAAGAPPGPRQAVGGGSAAVPDVAAAHGPVVMLTAGEQLTVHESGSADAVREVDAKRALAWSDGRLVFDDQSLAAVVAQFNRYNNLQMHVTGDALAKRTMSGVFDASDPESFIAFLRMMTPVRVSRSGQDITITPAR